MDPRLFFGTNSQKEKYLDSLLSGDQLGGFAFSEEDIRLKKELPHTLALQTETGWVLTGKKHMVSNANLADFLLVFARTKRFQMVKKEQEYLLSILIRKE